MRTSIFLGMASLGLFLAGCDGDYQGQPGQKTIDVKQKPDLDPRTDHDIDVNPPDVDVDVQKRPGDLPEVKVDAFKTPDKNTKADQ